MAMTDNLEKMLASGRDDPMLRFGLGSAYFNQKEYDKAVPHLEACISQDADYSAAYKLLGKAHYELDDLAAAKSVFANGLEVASRLGDKQSEKEITAFQNKIARKGE